MENNNQNNLFCSFRRGLNGTYSKNDEYQIKAYCEKNKIENCNKTYPTQVVECHFNYKTHISIYIKETCAVEVLEIHSVILKR